MDFSSQQTPEGLFTPWTTKSSKGPVKFVIGCWTRPRTTSVYTKEQNVKVSMGVRGPQKIYILRPTLSNDVVQRVLWWEKPQKRCSSRKRRGPQQRNVVIDDVYIRKEKTREWSNLISFLFFSFQNYHLGKYIKKFNTFTFWCMVIPLGPHSVYT